MSVGMSMGKAPQDARFRRGADCSILVQVLMLGLLMLAGVALSLTPQSHEVFSAAPGLQSAIGLALISAALLVLNLYQRLNYLQGCFEMGGAVAYIQPHMVERARNRAIRAEFSSVIEAVERGEAELYRTQRQLKHELLQLRASLRWTGALTLDAVCGCACQRPLPVLQVHRQHVGTMRVSLFATGAQRLVIGASCVRSTMRWCCWRGGPTTPT